MCLDGSPITPHAELISIIPVRYLQRICSTRINTSARFLFYIVQDIGTTIFPLSYYSHPFQLPQYFYDLRIQLCYFESFEYYTCMVNSLGIYGSYGLLSELATK